MGKRPKSFKKAEQVPAMKDGEDWVFEGWPDDPSDVEGIDKARALRDEIAGKVEEKRIKPGSGNQGVSPGLTRAQELERDDD